VEWIDMGHKWNKLICIHYLKYSVGGYYFTGSNPSEDVKKLYFITVTFQTKLKVFRQGFADYEDGILVSLIRRRNEPFLTEFFEALRPFNAIFLAYHQN